MRFHYNFIRLSTVLFALLITCPLPAQADFDYDITAHYYKKTPDKKFKDFVQWKITNIDEWNQFVLKLKLLPDTSDPGTPLDLGVDELIHFHQVSPDMLSGNDVYISKAGIQQYARMPTDVFYYEVDGFREFLGDERKAHPGYGSDVENKKVNISTPGIVIVFRGSTVMKNPWWVINKPEDMDRYMQFLQKLVPIPSSLSSVSEIKRTAYDSEGAFLIYLNYPGAPAQILTVVPSGGIRGTTVEDQRFFYRDAKNYYAVFKMQVDNIVKGVSAKHSGIAIDDASKRF